MTIPPQHMTEALIQAEFYHQCRLLDIPCLVERRIPSGRVDLAVCSKDYSRLLVIVEVKDGEGYSEWQLTRYGRVGVDVILLNKLEDVSRTVQDIKDKYVDSGYLGRTWEQVWSVEPLPRRRSRRWRNHPLQQLRSLGFDV